MFRVGDKVKIIDDIGEIDQRLKHTAGQIGLVIHTTFFRNNCMVKFDNGKSHFYYKDEIELVSDISKYFIEELKRIGVKTISRREEFETKEDVDRVIDFMDKTINKSDSKE